jgi:hypothetical protein
MILKGAEGKCMDIGGDDLGGSSSGGSGGFGEGGSGGAGDSGGTNIAIASGPAAVADSIGDTGLRAGFRAQLLMGEWVVLPAGCQPWLTEETKMLVVTRGTVDQETRQVKAAAAKVCKKGEICSIDGQVRLVRLQTDNFCLFLLKQTDKRRNSVCKISKR